MFPELYLSQVIPVNWCTTDQLHPRWNRSDSKLKTGSPPTFLPSLLSMCAELPASTLAPVQHCVSSRFSANVYPISSSGS